MTDDRLYRIKAIQKQIVDALEKGEDVTKLRNELARVRAEIAADAEVEELRRISTARQALRNKASEVQQRVSLQGEAIDTFLAERDELVAQLKPLLEPMAKVARMANPPWEKEPGGCYAFPDAANFTASVKGIPKELLPTDFACPILEMTASGERSLGKAREAATYLQFCIGILANFRKGNIAAHTRGADDSLLLNVDTDITESRCMVCEHPKAEAINNALREGRSLRDIEAEFTVSRSTLSRHKNKCLNLGVITIVEET